MKKNIQYNFYVQKQRTHSRKSAQPTISARRPDRDSSRWAVTCATRGWSSAPALASASPPTLPAAAAKGPPQVSAPPRLWHPLLNQLWHLMAAPAQHKSSRRWRRRRKSPRMKSMGPLMIIRSQIRRRRAASSASVTGAWPTPRAAGTSISAAAEECAGSRAPALCTTMSNGEFAGSGPIVVTERFDHQENANMDFWE